MYCVFPPRVKSPFITIYPPLLFSTFSHPPFPLVITMLLSVSRSFFHFCLIPSPFSPSPPIPLSCDSCQSVFCLYSLFLFCLFCSLDSTYKWNHMIFDFLWLANFTKHNTLQVCLCCLKRSDFILFYALAYRALSSWISVKTSSCFIFFLFYLPRSLLQFPSLP